MTNQSKVDQICKNVEMVFNPPRIRFMKLSGWPASAGMRISFDHQNNTKTITFSKEYIEKHSKDHLAKFLSCDPLTKLRREGDQHLFLK